MQATPPTEVNITELTTKAIEAIGKIYGSENIASDYGQIPFFNDDFAYFQHHVPGVYVFLGGSNFEKGLISMPHSPDFAVNEESIRVGVKYFSSLIVERTKKYLSSHIHFTIAYKKMKGKIKAHTVDRYLRPIRLQIVDLIEPKSTVMEVGCGNGDLLFKLSNKIRSGVGLDNSNQLIAFATDRIEKEQVKNLTFKLADITQDTFPDTQQDYAIASLLLHILPWENAVELVKKMISNSNTTLICGFSKPENFKQKMLLWFDQRFTKHHSNFKIYAKNSYTEGLLNLIQHIQYRKIDTFDPVIKIYEITKNNKRKHV
jgi:ubiquinone/menaquinone biosynthesis C-methylase UbiE